MESYAKTDINSPVRDYTPRDLQQGSIFPILPPKVKDFHLGGLVFASAKARYHSVDLRQYRIRYEKQVCT